MTYTRSNVARYVSRANNAIKKARQKTCDHDPIIVTEGRNKGMIRCQKCGLITPNHTEPTNAE